MKFILAIFLMNLFNCSADKTDKTDKTDKEGIKRYYTKSQESFIELDFSKKESILGNHCFIFNNGDKIDCCIDEKSYSLKIELETNGSFKGSFISCYDENEYDVILKIEGKSLILSFKNEEYPFISSSLTFYEK